MDILLGLVKKDLGLLKARLLVARFEKRIGQNIRAQLEVYYQDLYNLPVENSPTSFYSFSMRENSRHDLLVCVDNFSEELKNDGNLKRYVSYLQFSEGSVPRLW